MPDDVYDANSDLTDHPLLGQMRYGAEGRAIQGNLVGESRTGIRRDSLPIQESGRVNHTYDNAGNTLSRTDARGIVTCFGSLSGSTCSGSSYDAVNRPVSVSYSDGTPTVTLSYDGVTNGMGN